MEKKKQTFAVLFWIRKGRTSEKLSPMFCRITICGQRYEISTNLRVRSESWSPQAQKSLGKTPNDREINRAIEDLKVSINETVAKLRQKNYVLNIENFKLMFKAQENEYSTITTLFNYHMIIEKKKLSESSCRQYGITLKHLQNFIRIKYHVANYDITAIDKSFVFEFYAYLQGFKREDNKKLCNINGAIKHIQRFKKVMNIALQNEWIQRNPVNLLHAKRVKVDKGFLTEEEVKAIQKLALTSSLNIIRDMFIFAVYTGISYTDAVLLTKENFIIGIDKTLWLTYKRKKTGIRVAIPLLEPAMEILKRYETYAAGKSTDKIFPFPTNQVTNRELKVIAKAAGINKCVTYHLARHTFATSITLMHGIPIETVSKMLGHTNLTTTQIYASVADKKIMDDMKNLKSQFAAKAMGENKAINE